MPGRKRYLRAAVGPRCVRRTAYRYIRRLGNAHAAHLSGGLAGLHRAPLLLLAWRRVCVPAPALNAYSGEEEEEGGRPYVELDLACGLFDLKDSAAVAAAERSLTHHGVSAARRSSTLQRREGVQWFSTTALGAPNLGACPVCRSGWLGVPPAQLGWQHWC